VKFGYASWLPETELVSKFIEGLGNNKLLGTKCKKCNQKYLPPRAHCKCGSTDLEWIDVPNKGRIRSYTIVSFAPESMSRYAPYIVGVAEVEGGMSLMGQLTGVTPSTLKVGLPVQIVAHQPDTDRIVYKFKPA